MLTCCGPSLKTSSATANILSCWLVWACTFTPVHNKQKPTLLIRLFGTGINTFAFFRCGSTTKPSTFEANQWLNDPSSIGTQTAQEPGLFPDLWIVTYISFFPSKSVAIRYHYQTQDPQTKGNTLFVLWSSAFKSEGAESSQTDSYDALKVQSVRPITYCRIVQFIVLMSSAYSLNHINMTCLSGDTAEWITISGN